MSSEIQVRAYLQTINEDDFRKIFMHFLERRCGETREYHGSTEHGLDIASVYDGKYDFINNNVTILIQAKVGRVSLPQLRENIFGQMAELFSRKITISPFHPHNPRRLLLVVAGEINNNALELVEKWNDQMPIPIELLELNRVSELLWEEYEDIEKLRKIVAGEPLDEPEELEEETKTVQMTSGTELTVEEN